jgi:hypothetical protein
MNGSIRSPYMIGQGDLMLCKTYTTRISKDRTYSILSTRMIGLSDSMFCKAMQILVASDLM